MKLSQKVVRYPLLDGTISEWFQKGAVFVCIVVLLTVLEKVVIEGLFGEETVSFTLSLFLPAIFSYFLIIVLTLSVIKAVKDRLRTVSSLSTLALVLIMALIIVLSLNGITGLYVFNDWDYFIEIRPERSWIAYLLLPMFVLLPVTISKGNWSKQNAALVIFALLTGPILAWVSYDPFFENLNNGGLLNLLRGLVMVIVAMIWLLTTELSLPGIRSDLKNPKRSMLTITRAIKQPVLFLFIIISSTSFGIFCDNLAWTSYRIDLDLPEGGDLDLARDTLSQNLSSMVGEEPFSRSIFDPVVINWSNMMGLKKEFKERQRKMVRGHHYLDIEVSVQHEQTFYVVKKNGTFSYYGNWKDPKISFGYQNNNKRYHDWPASAYININGSISNLNSTGLWGQWKESDIDVRFSDVDMIEMRIDIGRQWGSLAGYGGDFHQYIYVRNGKVLFIITQRDNWIS